MRTTASLSIAVLVVLLLVGCRAEVRSDVSLSRLQDDSVQQIPARLRVEVITCRDLQDSRNPSRWLTEAREIVGRMLPSAEFVECHSEGVDDWAVFNLPLAIDRDGDPSTFPSQDTISLRSIAQTPLKVAVPRPVFRRGESELERVVAPRFSSLEVTLNVLNDTGETFEAWVLASWVDGEPRGASIIRIPDGQSAELTLADVLIREAWDNQETTVLERGCDAAAGEDCQDALSARR